MRILLTNNHIAERAGSELVVTELAEGLQARGHDVSLFTLFPGRFGEDFAGRSGIPIHSPLSGGMGEADRPDVIHVTHWPTVLYLRVLGITAPSIYAFLGVLPPLENPPPVEAGGPPIAWCVSEEVAGNISSISGWPGAADIAVVRNWIAPDFDRQPPIRSAALEKVAVVSNHFPLGYLTMLRTLSAEIGFTLEVIGLPDNSIEITPQHLLGCDAVISLGRTAIAAAGLGIPTLILDTNGGDGWLTVENFRLSQRCNFSGRGLALQPDEEQIRRWLREPPSSAETLEIAEIVRREHSFADKLDQVEALLARAVEQRPIQTFGRHCDVVTELVESISHRQVLADATSVELRHTTEELNRTTEELNRTTEELRRTTEELRHTTEELRHTTEELNRIRDESDHIRSEVDATRAAVENALTERDVARGALNELKSSTSWRITAPARAVTGRFQRRT